MAPQTIAAAITPRRHIGGHGETCTPDLPIAKRVLSYLSYAPIVFVVGALGATRTRNLRLRRPTPCPLGHEGSWSGR